MTTIPAIFNSKEIRRTLHNGEWWFAVCEVVEALTGSGNGSAATKEMRERDNELAKGWGQLITPLLLETPSGRH